MGCFSTSGLPLGTWVWVIEMLIGTWTERPERGRREGKERNAVCASGRDERERDERDAERSAGRASISASFEALVVYMPSLGTSSNKRRSKSPLQWPYYEAFVRWLQVKFCISAPLQTASSVPLEVRAWLRQVSGGRSGLEPCSRSVNWWGVPLFCFVF
jgi:hypothetical protein